MIDLHYDLLSILYYCYLKNDFSYIEEVKKFLRKAIDLGISIDLSHMNHNTFYDTVSLLKEEKNKGKDVCVIVSHSNCYSLCNHPRNLDDEQILSLKEFNPVIGLVSYGPFVSSSTDIGQLRKEYVEHIKHVISLLGEDAVGVSTDDMKFDYELLGNSDDIQLFSYKSIGNELEKLLKENGISNVKKIMFENSYNKLFRRN